MSSIAVAPGDPLKALEHLVNLLDDGCEDPEQLDVAVRTLKQVASPHGEDASILDRPIEVSKLRSEKGMTPLEVAVQRQNNAAVDALLRHGAQPDAIFGLPCTCLCRVCYAFPSNISMMRRLLDAGASPDATTNNDSNSASCLIISVVKDNVKAVELLLQHGVELSYEWKGSNAVAMAADFKKTAITELFEQHEFKAAKANRWKRYQERKVLEEERERVIAEKKMKLKTGTNVREHYRSGSTDSAQAQSSSSTPPISPSNDRRGDTNSSSVSGGGQHSGQPALSPTNNMPVPSPPKREESKSLHLLQTPDRGENDGKRGSSVHVLDIELEQRQREIEAEAEDAISPNKSAELSHHHHSHTDSPPENVISDAIRAKRRAEEENFSSQMEAMDWVIPLRELEIGPLISAGAHGEVYKCTLKSTGDVVALKKFLCLDAAGRECFRREVVLLSRFRHENIVMFRGAVIDAEMCGLVSELCCDTIYDRLHTAAAREKPPSWDERLRWARDIARAMTYLHTRSPPVVHRDLKSMNVLLDTQGNVKLCDFGMARVREHTYITTQHIAGSPSWMAPEVLRGDDFNDQSDIYSFGVVLWEIVTMKVPWPDKTMAQLVGLIGFSGNKLPIPSSEKVPGCPVALLSIIEACFAPPAERPPFRTLRTLLENVVAGGEEERR